MGLRPPDDVSDADSRKCVGYAGRRDRRTLAPGEARGTARRASPNSSRIREMIDSSESFVRVFFGMRHFHSFLLLNTLRDGAMRGDGAAGLKRRFPTSDS